MIRNIAILSLFTFSFFACGQTQQSTQSSGGRTDQKVAQFETSIGKTDANILILDVRTPDEYNDGHIEGAVNVNYYEDNFLTQAQNKISESEGAVVYVYCKAGGRSAKAANLLVKNDASGKLQVVNLLGGFDAWKDAGKAVKH